MSSGYLCGSMSLLSEKESLETWEKSDMFRNLIPQGATAHSFDYLRALVARRAASSSQSQDPAASPLITSDSLRAPHQHHHDLQHQHHLLPPASSLTTLPPLVQKDAADDGETKKSTDGFVFETVETDEATAEMFMQQESEEEAESIRKQRELLDTNQDDSAASSSAQQQDASADAQQRLLQDQQQSNDPQHAGTRRQRDGTAASPNHTSAQQQQMAQQQQQHQQRAAARHLADASVLAQLFGFQPGTLERYRGRVRTFLFDQGYGFIQPHAAVEFAEQRSKLSPEEEEKSPLPHFPFGDVELFVSSEDIMNLGPAAATAGGMDAQTNRAMRMLCPGEEVEFSIVIAQTNHGQSLRAVRLTGSNASPLLVQMPSMRQRGVVRLWDMNRRFGFLTPLPNYVPPPGLAKLEEGRILPEAAHALRKSGDVFTLASNILWDQTVPHNERFLSVGVVVEYTAVLRKNDPGRGGQDGGRGGGRGGRGDRGGRGGAGGNQHQQSSSEATTRTVAVCVTDFTYRPVDPQMLERTTGELAKNEGSLAQAVASGSLQTARPGVLGSLPTTGSGAGNTGADHGADMLLDGMDGNLTW